jgi:peroxiredoxin
MTMTSPVPAASTVSPRSTAFTAFWLFASRRSNDGFGADASATLVQSLADLLADRATRVEIRAAYSTAGLCAGVDLILWLVADDCAAIQNLALQINRTDAGQRLELKQVYLGVASMSQYDPEHGPAFLRGLEPREYLSVYPFTKTPEWYLLPFEQRRDLMIEHGKMGKEFPTILTNTVSSFGIADQEFIVALEDDDPAVLVKMVQRLRSAEVRKWTQIDTPIYLGRKLPLTEALANCL